MNYMNYVNNMWCINTLVLDCIDNWDIVTLCFITPIKEVCLNWQNFIGYRIHGHFQQLQMYPNTLKIHIIYDVVCVTYFVHVYNKYISSKILLVMLFIDLSLFKTIWNKSKTCPLTTIKIFLWVCHFL